MFRINYPRKWHLARAQHFYGSLNDFWGIVDPGAPSFNIHPITRLNDRRISARPGFRTFDSHPGGIDENTGGRVLDEEELGFAIAVGHHSPEDHRISLTCLMRAELPRLRYSSQDGVACCFWQLAPY